MADNVADTQEETQIYVCDINPNMLNVGKKRAMERGIKADYALIKNWNPCSLFTKSPLGV